METLAVGFLVKLFDIPGAVIGLSGGWLSKRWWHLALTALIGGSAGEAFLYFVRGTRDFDPTVWLAGVAASFVWAMLSFTVKRVLQRAK